jgi:hypothetical protein
MVIAKAKDGPPQMIHWLFALISFSSSMASLSVSEWQTVIRCDGGDLLIQKKSLYPSPEYDYQLVLKNNVVTWALGLSTTTVDTYNTQKPFSYQMLNVDRHLVFYKNPPIRSEAFYYMGPGGENIKLDLKNENGFHFLKVEIQGTNFQFPTYKFQSCSSEG